MTNVADLEVGQLDALGQVITRLYGRRARVYGVYGVRRRVMVCYADASEGDLANQQRKAMAELAPVRGEIDGLIDGWREGTDRSLWGARQSPAIRAKADGYNRRVADALAVALESDIPRATTILGTIKQEILDERVARARFEYLIAALLTAAMLMFGSWLVTSTYGLAQEGPENWARRVSGVGRLLQLLALLAAAVLFYVRWSGLSEEKDGAAGDERGVATGDEKGAAVPTEKASTILTRFSKSFFPSVFLFFAIVIPITAMLLCSAFLISLPQYYLSDYTESVTMWRAAAAGSVGAFFSIAIGMRGRTILPDLLRTSNLMDAALRVSIGFIAAAVLIALLKLNVVTMSLGGYQLNHTDLVGVLAAGFLAGFSERLVPDLLAKANASPGGVAPAGISPPPPPHPPASLASAAGADKARADAAPDADGAGDADPLPQEAHEDGCVCDHAIDDDQVTQDDELPPASGGVASSAEEQVS